MSEVKISRGGRPPLVPGDRPARVQVAVPSREYDRAYQQAAREGVSLPALLRRGLSRVLEDEDDGA